MTRDEAMRAAATAAADERADHERLDRLADRLASVGSLFENPSNDGVPDEKALKASTDELAGIYFGEVRKRLAKGEAEYGDASFARPSSDLLGELQEEASDLGGWGFVLWNHLRWLRAQASQIEASMVLTFHTEGPGLAQDAASLLRGLRTLLLQDVPDLDEETRAYVEQIETMKDKLELTASRVLDIMKQRPAQRAAESVELLDLKDRAKFDVDKIRGLELANRELEAERDEIFARVEGLEAKIERLEHAKELPPGRRIEIPPGAILSLPIRAQAAQLAAFAVWVFTASILAGGDLEAFKIQSKLEYLGLSTSTPFDPATVDADNVEDFGASLVKGDLVYFLQGWVRSLAHASLGDGGGE